LDEVLSECLTGGELNKSERLLYLLNYLNQSGRVSLHEIADNCKISERTVYRDIKDLTRIGYPIDFEEGYFLNTSAPHAVLNKFTESELRMIKFALETHPLGKLFPFSELAERLKCAELSKNSAQEPHPSYSEQAINRLSGSSNKPISDPAEFSDE